MSGLRNKYLAEYFDEIVEEVISFLIFLLCLLYFESLDDQSLFVPLLLCGLQELLLLNFRFLVDLLVQGPCSLKILIFLPDHFPLSNEGVTLSSSSLSSYALLG